MGKDAHSALGTWLQFLSNLTRYTTFHQPRETARAQSVPRVTPLQMASPVHLTRCDLTIPTTTWIRTTPS
eukprot:5389450-Pleurochrysis_carterae.AAC.1